MLPTARYSMAYVQYVYNTYIFSTNHLPRVKSFFLPVCIILCFSPITFETMKPPSVKAARVYLYIEALIQGIRKACAKI